MSDAAIHNLRDALGVSRPIRIAVSSQQHPQPQVAEIDSPFGIIGRSNRCNITLEDRSVSFRHAYLQAFGDRVVCIDLLNPQAITWHGPETSGWMSADHRVGIGPYALQLADDGWGSEFKSWPSPLDCKTRTENPTPFGELPKVHLALRNQQFQGMSWPINRVLTLVGRDDRCRITCADERISRVHCSLLLTPYGLWVIDLLGRGGIRVNARRERCALLMGDDELQVGRYLMKAVYETAPKEFPQGEPMTPHQPDTTEIKIPQEILLEDTLPSPEFLTRNNEIFPATIASPVIIVEPRGGIRSSGYQQIQLESNIITQLLKTRTKLPHLVVDIHHADAMDSIIINAVMAMCRAAKGKAALCNPSDAMREVISEINLTRLWPMFPNRDEALQYVTSD